MKIGEIDLADASRTSIDVGTIICEDLSHEIWTIPNDAAVDIPATTESVGRAQTVLSYMSSMGCICRRWVACVVNRQYVSLKGYVSLEGYVPLKGGYVSLKGVYVVVVAIATRRRCYSSPSPPSLPVVVGFKVPSWVD